MEIPDETLERKIRILNSENENLVLIDVKVLNLTNKFQEKILSLDEKFSQFSPDEIKNYEELVKALRIQYFTLENKIDNFTENQNHIHKYFAEVKSFIENIETKFENLEKKVDGVQPNINKTLITLQEALAKFENITQEMKIKVNNYYTKLDLDEKLKQKIEISELDDEIEKSISNKKIFNIFQNEIQNSDSYMNVFLRRNIEFEVKKAVNSLKTRPPHH